MNVFWKHRGNDDFPKEILDCLLSERVIEKCIIETKHIDAEYINKHPQLFAIHNSVGVTMGYDEIIDANELEALDEDIILKMMPYESMAIQLGIRRNNIPNTLYEVERRNYFIHLRFWYHMFKKYQIEAAMFSMTPHCQSDYVIYALAKALGLPTIVCSPTIFSDSLKGLSVFCWGNSIETVGSNIEKTYSEMNDISGNEVVLNGRIKEYYEFFDRPTLEEVKKVRNPGADNETMAVAKEQAKHFWNQKYDVDLLFKLWLKMQYRKMKFGLFSERTQSAEMYFFNVLSNYFYIKNIMEVVPKSYKWTEDPNLNEKYIYYALSFFPEETTIPRSRCFYDQLPAIQLLSRITAKLGIKVYVKDHPHLLYRDRRLYHDIKKLPNVKIIRANYPTYDIVYNSVACAAINGSAIVESVLLGRPALVFDSSYIWYGMPGVFRVKNEAEGKNILNRIGNGYKIDLKDIKRYFAAIQKNVIVYEAKDKTSGNKAAIYNEKIIGQIFDLFEELKESVEAKNGLIKS